MSVNTTRDENGDVKTKKGRGQRRSRRNSESLRRHNRIERLHRAAAAVAGWAIAGLLAPQRAWVRLYTSV